MVTLVRHEWHQVDSQSTLELDEDLLREIYPDSDDDEIAELLQDLENGEADIDQIIGDAYDNGVDVDWDHQYDDWWTARKGGYDVTYEYGDEDSYVEPNKEPDPTHKCSKCRWTGSRWATLTQYLREDGSVIEDYYNSEEESDNTKEVCPMCDSDVELTEAGVIDEQERKEREARWAEMDDEDENDPDQQARLKELEEEFNKLMTEEENHDDISNK